MAEFAGYTPDTTIELPMNKNSTTYAYSHINKDKIVYFSSYVTNIDDTAFTPTLEYMVSTSLPFSILTLKKLVRR